MTTTIQPDAYWVGRLAQALRGVLDDGFDWQVEANRMTARRTLEEFDAARVADEAVAS